MAGVDVVVAGGGPAGLAAAIACAAAGARVVVLERRGGDLDQACGEGVMPAGVAALAQLGVLSGLAPGERAPIAGIAYTQEDGTRIRAGFVPGQPGLGVRRTALVAALRDRARALGVELRAGATYQSHAVGAQAADVFTSQGVVRARLLVGADGRDSSVRDALGYTAPAVALRRFGVRRHFERVAPTDVEVHWAEGVEAYVTPVGPRRVGVAFLASREALAKSEGAAPFDRLLARFPRLAAWLAGATPRSASRGSGVLLRGARRVAGDRVVLLGDAAGYIDAITGEGLSLAFRSALALGAIVPHALAAGASRTALAPYARAHAALFRPYAQTTRLLLALAARPALRRVAFRTLAHAPWLFTVLVRAVGHGDTPWRATDLVRGLPQ